MRWRPSVVSAAVTVALVASVPVVSQDRADEPPWQAFLAAAGPDQKQAQSALAEIAARWRDSYAAMRSQNDRCR